MNKLWGRALVVGLGLMTVAEIAVVVASYARGRGVTAYLTPLPKNVVVFWGAGAVGVSCGADSPFPAYVQIANGGRRLIHGADEPAYMWWPHATTPAGSQGSAAYWDLWTPAWLVVVVATGLQMVALRTFTLVRRRRRRTAGQCPHCGYDQRGNPTESCPECGHVNAAAADVAQE